MKISCPRWTVNLGFRELSLVEKVPPLFLSVLLSISKPLQLPILLGLNVSYSVFCFQNNWLGQTMFMAQTTLSEIENRHMYHALRVSFIFKDAFCQRVSNLWALNTLKDQETKCVCWNGKKKMRLHDDPCRNQNSSKTKCSRPLAYPSLFSIQNCTGQKLQQLKLSWGSRAMKLFRFLPPICVQRSCGWPRFLTHKQLLYEVHSFRGIIGFQNYICVQRSCGRERLLTHKE